jgi:hypothetical protein
LSLNKYDCIILPKTVAFEDLTSAISYDTTDANQAALITYSYNDVTLGTVSVDLAMSKEDKQPFGNSEDWTDDATSPDNTGDSTGSDSTDDPKQNAEQNSSQSSGISFVFINVAKVLFWVLGIAAAVLLFFIIRAFLKNYQINPRRGRRRRVAARRYKPTRQQLARRRRRNSIINKFRDYD